MRRFSCCILALFAFGPVARAAEIRAFEDATLRAVHFVDDNVGWAVGDDGVVWNTLDAGHGAFKLVDPESFAARYHAPASTAVPWARRRL